MLPEDFAEILDGIAMMYGANIPASIWEGMGLDPAEVAESPEYLALLENIENGGFYIPEVDDEPVFSPRLRGNGKVRSDFRLLDLDISAFASSVENNEDEDEEDEDDEDIISENVIHTDSSEGVVKTFATRLEGEKRVHIYL